MGFKKELAKKSTLETFNDGAPVDSQGVDIKSPGKMHWFTIKGTTYEGLDDYLTGPTMLGFSYDEPGAAAKILRKYSKLNENLTIKGLSVDGVHLEGSEIDKLASLPTFNEAISKIAGLLKAPLGKIASLMNEIPSKFARTLHGVKEQKG